MANLNLSAIQTRQRKLRLQLFPNIAEHQLWDRRTKTGFATLPRALPLVTAIMDGLSPQKPISSTYLALWCRSWDDPLISIGSKLVEVALEAGFSGQRAQNSVYSRLAILQELGFVRFAPGAGGQYSYALLLNPYQILALHRSKISDQNWNALLGRMAEIGADDLDPAPTQPENVVGTQGSALTDAPPLPPSTSLDAVLGPAPAAPDVTQKPRKPKPPIRGSLK